MQTDTAVFDHFLFQYYHYNSMFAIMLCNDLTWVLVCMERTSRLENQDTLSCMMSQADDAP